MVFKTIGTSLSNFINKSWTDTVKDFKISGISSLIKGSDTVALNQYVKALQNGKTRTEAFKNTLSSASSVTKKQAVEIAKLHTQYKTGEIDSKTYSAQLKILGAETETVSLKTKLATAGFQLFKAALSTIAFIAIIQGISALVKGLSDLSNNVEKTKEKVRDLTDEFDTAISSANNNAKKTEELVDDYEKLSKGVNNLGENVSLTNDEYDKYKSVVNEIADMFPNLIQGYDNEGNAILNLKGNVEQLRDAYKEAQKEAYNLLIVGGKNGDGNDIVKQWQDIQDSNVWAKLFDFGAYDVGKGISVSDAMEQLQTFINMSKERYEQIQEIYTAAYSDSTGIFDTEFSKTYAEALGYNPLSDIEYNIIQDGYLEKYLNLKNRMSDDDFSAAKEQANALVQTYNAEIETALSDVKSLANAYLITNDDYNKLDEQSKTSASLIVNSLDENIANDFTTKTDVSKYTNKIIKAFDNANVKEAINNLFTLDTSNIPINEINSQIDKYINIIASAIEEDPNKLKIRLGFDDIDKTLERAKAKFKTQANSTQKISQDEINNFLSNLTLDDLNIAMQIPDLFANGLDAAKQKIADFNSSSDSKINVSVNSDDDISEITDNVSKKVKLISTAMEEMNDTGSISSSTYGEIVEMGGNFTDCLEVQNGKLTLNVQRLKELETQEFETAKAATELAIAELQANSSINSASDFALYEEKLKELKKQQAFYQTLIDDINNAAPSSSETSNTETKETEPKSVTDFKAEYARKQHEINMGRMEEDEDYYSWLEKAAHTAYDGLKDYEDDLWKYEEEVYKGRKQLADDFYDEQQKDLDDRISALENNIETATEYSTDINGNNLDLEEKIDYISSAYREIINEINGRVGEILDIGIEGHEDDVAELEEQIEEYQKKLDGVFDDVFKTAAENEKEYIENLKDKYSNLYDERIDKIKEQQEAAEKSAQAEVDAIQEKIDKLKKSNEKEQEALDIAKARRELEKASQATRQVYGADGTISFEADEEKIQEAQENLNNLLLEQQTNILEEQKELLEQTKDKQSEAYDSIIDNLEAEKENEEKRFDILLDVLNEYLNPEQDKSNSEVWKILSHIEGASYKNGIWSDKDGNTINLDELINSVDKKIEDKQNTSEYNTDKKIDKNTTSSNNDKKTDVIISGTLERLVLGSKTSDTQDNNIKDSYNKFLSSLENKLGLNDGTLVFEKIKKAFANTYGAANNSYMNISERMGNIGRGYTNTVNNNNNNASNVNIGDIIINNPVTNSNDLAKELMLNLPNAFQKQMYTNLK